MNAIIAIFWIRLIGNATHVPSYAHCVSTIPRILSLSALNVSLDCTSSTITLRSLAGKTVETHTQLGIPVIINSMRNMTDAIMIVKFKTTLLVLLEWRSVEILYVLIMGLSK